MAAGGLIYTAQFQDISITNVVQDLIQLATAATAAVLIHSIRVEFTPTIVSGVAQDVRLALAIVQRSTVGTGGTGVTPSPVNPRNTVSAQSTVTRTVVTTQGTLVNTLGSFNSSVIVPFERIYTPDQRVPVPASAATKVYSLFLAATNAALPLTASLEMYFEEI